MPPKSQAVVSSPTGPSQRKGVNNIQTQYRHEEKGRIYSRVAAMETFDGGLLNLDAKER